jgi:hypothetical protein
LARKSTKTHIIGSVSTGKIWEFAQEFAQLDRINKRLDQGLDSYHVPDDLNPLMRILVQALI